MLIDQLALRNNPEITVTHHLCISGVIVLGNTMNPAKPRHLQQVHIYRLDRAQAAMACFKGVRIYSSLKHWIAKTQKLIAKTQSNTQFEITDIQRTFLKNRQ